MSIRKYLVEKYNLSALDRSEKVHKRCLDWMKEALEEPYLKSLLWNMQEKGCSFPYERFICEPCNVNGLYDIERKEVVLCENNMTTKSAVGDTLSHELIHAFDDCINALDETNLKQVACSEIRAVNLQTNNWSSKDQKDIVRRHAVKNLLEQGNLDKEQAAFFVDTMFEECFYDCQPFDKQRTSN